MKLAVTGGTGFVGRHVLPLLAQQSWSVNVLVRDPMNVVAAQNMTIIPGNVSDRAALDQLCLDCDVMLHMAGAISGTPDHMMHVNAEGTKNAIAAAAAAGVRRFIYVSSLAAREPDLSAYGKSKSEAEMAVRLAPRELQTLIVRPSAVYGEGDEATLPLLKMLMSHTAMIPGTAKARFSLIHVEDLARILVAAVGGNVEGLREVDDGHGGYTWGQVAEVTQWLFGRPKSTFHIPKIAAFAVGHAGDFAAKVTGRPSMVSADKMRQLYHHDWAVQPPGMPREKPIPLTEGMRRTLLWSMDKGLLPRVSPIDRSPAS